jgi:NTP pyrophosphatase (non-canonical NTP hydrolase)
MIVEFRHYQAEAMKSRMIPGEHNLTYAALGLAGEAGELANKVKKILRGDTNRDELLDGIKSEMGDVLWYLAALADDLGVDLAEIADENIKKIRSRQARGQLKGGGDNR